MQILDQAVDEGIISAQQRDQIVDLQRQTADRFPETGIKLSLVHVLWTAGVLLGVVALAILANEIGGQDPWSMMLVAVSYAALFALLDYVIRDRSSLRVLSSLLVLAIGFCLALALVMIQEQQAGARWFGYPRWGEDEGGRPSILVRAWYSSLLPLLPIVVTGVWALRLRAFLPAWLLVFPALVVAGYEILQLGGAPTTILGFNLTTSYLLLSALVGLGFAWRLDLKSRINHGFWLNKLGLLLFGLWLGDTYYDFEFVVMALGVLTIFASIFWRRPFGISVGAAAIGWYIIDLFDWWDEPIVLAAVLGLIGLGLLFLGVRFKLIESRLESMLPAGLRALRPNRREDPVIFSGPR